MVITHYIPTIKSFQAKVELLFGRLEVDEFLSKPSKGGWSIQQCIQHLTLSGNLYADQIQVAIENNSKSYYNGCTHRKFQRFVIWLMEPPYHLSFRAPGSFKPVPENKQNIESVNETINSFSELQERLIHQIRTVHYQNMSGVIFHSPLSLWFKLSMCEAFGMICAHERRHIWQAENILKAFREKHLLIYNKK